MADIVNSNMERINKKALTNYTPFNYYGAILYHEYRNA